MRSLLPSIFVIGSMDSFGQITTSFESIDGKAWQNISVEEVKSLFSEVPREWNAPPSRTYLMGGPCISMPGPLFIQFDSTGVQFLFDRTDTSQDLRLRSLLVTKAGAVVTPDHIDVGGKINVGPNSDESQVRQVHLGGKKYLEQYRSGYFYYCLPASLKKVKKGGTVRVKYIRIRDYPGSPIS